jgi:hypothetical protein
MAISSGDSLYVASALLRDPSIDDGPKVRRIPGDICRAGIALLMAPDHTKVQEPEVDKWFMISHNQYDGSKDDHFEATSLHLSFTGSEEALNIGSRGGKFVHAYFIETNISVFHEGIWVADLDILRCCSEAENLLRIGSKTHCNDFTQLLPVAHITAIDNWEELLTVPENCAVVRANGNWLARLALASVSSYKGFNTVVLPPTACCWHSVTSQVNARFYAGAPGAAAAEKAGKNDDFLRNQRMIFIQ